MTVLLVRHARAGRRQDWRDDDRLRPLSPKGWQQAEALAEALPGLIPRRDDVTILCSPWVRCAQTVSPLAKVLELEPEERSELGEGEGSVAIDFVLGLSRGEAVVCTHGDVVIGVLDALRSTGVDLGSKPAFPKGSTWVLQTRAGVFVAARYVPPPR